MPVKSCSENGSPGYKWGEQGACYTYPKGNLAQQKKAKKKAFYQGLAIGEASNFKKRDGGYRTVSKDDNLTDLIKSEDMINGYPAATQDISVNIANRQDCIDIANYGPMNPAIDNIPFWQAKADIFNTTIDEAKTARCGNCAAFIQTTDMKEAIASGLGGEEDAYAVVNLANLGYCEIFDFKCAATRTCDAWVVGGPLTDNNFNVTKFDLLRYIMQGLSPFGVDSTNKEIK